MEGKWVWVGAAASLGMGLLAYVLSEDKLPPRKFPPSLPVSTTLDILTALHQASTSILISLAGHSLQTSETAGEEGRERGKGHVDERRLRAAFEEVYRRFGVTEVEFRRGYERHRDNPDVHLSASLLLANHLRAQQGLSPASSCSTSLSPASVLWLFRTLYHLSAGRTLAKLSQLETEGVRLSPFDARFQTAAKELEREQETLRDRLRERLGAGEEDVRAAVEVFAGDVQFLREYNEVEEEYRTVMQKIALQRLNEEGKSKVQAQMAAALLEIAP